jgi:hypothetical protein
MLGLEDPGEMAGARKLGIPPNLFNLQGPAERIAQICIEVTDAHVVRAFPKTSSCADQQPMQMAAVNAEFSFHDVRRKLMICMPFLAVNTRLFRRALS